MIKRDKYHKNKPKAFTLIEMIIVLIVMWILLMMSIWMSGSQVQKIQNKTVKESILSEWQSRYSRNLGSSSFAWEHYDTMNVEITSWSNQIKFIYSWDNITWSEIIFTDRFEIISVSWYNSPVTIKYNPYKISCSWWDNSWEVQRNDWNTENWKEQDENETLNFKTRVNNNQDYCFEINSKNCRLMEVECEEKSD